MRQALKIMTLLIGAAVSLAAFAQSDTGAGQQNGSLTLTSVETRAPGTYLADGNGFPLYVLVKAKGERTIAPQDTGDNGTQDSDRMHALPCKDECRQAWPPLTVDSADAAIKTRGDVDDSLIGTTQLEDGTIQITFNDYPLYYFRKDLNQDTEARGHLAGQAVKAFGGVWYVLGPKTGEPIVADSENTGS